MTNLYRYHNITNMPVGWLKRLLAVIANEYKEIHAGLRCARCRQLRADCPCGEKAVFEGEKHVP